ncbi:hypothetical protein PGB90_006892 [Kerria lacca]
MNEYLHGLTEEQLNAILSELGATKESLEKDVNNLKKWMEKQSHLPNVADEVFLANFLLRCKNSVEKTKKKLNSYYANRTLMSDIFLNRDPASEDFEKYSKLINFIVLPKLTADGDRVCIFKIFKAIKSSELKAEKFFEALTICMDVGLKIDRYRSMIIIYDMENATMALGAILFAIANKISTFSTEAYPIRYRKFYVLNLIPSFESFLTIATNFVKKKLSDRIEVWTREPKDLIEVLSKSILPSDYGGNEKSCIELNGIERTGYVIFQIQLWINYIKQFHDWIESEKSLRADLKKKSDDSSSISGIIGEYGVEGSFRKINID